MAKINGNEIRPGYVIEHDGGLWVAVKTNTVKPGKGGAYNQVELKNLINGTKLNERFRSAETVEQVRLDRIFPSLRTGRRAGVHGHRKL
jgi:elongation factor P